MARSSNPNFRNGVPEMLVLRLLQSEGEMYGYQLVQSMQERTGGALAVGEGVIYPVLHGLEHEGAVKSRRRTVNGRSRIYYSLTPAGSRRLAELAQDWFRVGDAVRTVLQGGQYAETFA